MLEAIKLFFEYSFWASEQTLKSLEQLSAEEYTAPGCSAHGSIRDTFAHMLATEVGYFSWLDGSMKLEQAYAFNVTGEEIDTAPKAREKYTQAKAQIQKFLSAADQAKLEQRISFDLPNGVSSSLPLWEILMHVANHDTHTRAQIIAAIRRMNKTPNGVEMIWFLLSSQQQPAHPGQNNL